MKHLMNSNDFFKHINESRISNYDISRSVHDSRTVKEFIQKTKNKTTIWDFVFNGRSRIYFDMDGKELDKKQIIRDSKDIVLSMNDISDLNKIDDSDVVIYTDINILKKIVDKCLSELGFVYYDFDDNICSKDPDGIRNNTTITSVLSRKNLKEVYKKIDLLNKYNQRNNKSVFNKPVKVKESDTSDKKYMIVFSVHPIDILAMSTSRSWEQRSCMRIGGENEHYVYTDIKNGSVVCYQTEYGDYNITKPNARILYKPYVNEENSEEYILFSDAAVYGEYEENFKEISMNIVDIEFNYNSMQGTFAMHCELYNDGQSVRIEKDMRDYNTVNDISLENFNRTYNSESASVALFNDLYNEIGGSVDIDKLSVLQKVYSDLEENDRDSIYMKFVSMIETYFEWSGDEYDFKDEYLDYVISSNVDAMYAYFVVYKILGDEYVNQQYNNYKENIFDNIDSFTKTYSSDGKYDGLYKLYQEYEKVSDEIEDFYELYDNLHGGIKYDIDNGNYKEFNSDTWIYDNITVENDKLMIFVDFGQRKNITLDELKDKIKED